MTVIRFLVFTLAIASLTPLFGQSSQRPEQATVDSEGVTPLQQVVVVTGARFAYKLVERWIDEYNKANPGVQIIIESRGATDPTAYDILAEVYEHRPEIRQSRDYVYVGRYAILPVANRESVFATTYCEKGLTADVINQVFFHSVFSHERKQQTIEAPFTGYTRLQKAGVPTVFSQYFGHKQEEIKGTAIAGSDAHLLKALLRDSSAVTFLPLPLIYDERTRVPVEGLAVLPVDLNGNRKVTAEEKFYETLDGVIERLEAEAPDKINNIPIEYLHLSVRKEHVSAEAIDFLKWIGKNGKAYLHAFGFMEPEEKYSSGNYNEFTSQREDK